MASTKTSIDSDEAENGEKRRLVVSFGESDNNKQDKQDAPTQPKVNLAKSIKSLNYQYYL